MTNTTKWDSEHSKFWSRFLFWLWIYTLLVILWGAWVRISHSGDGCGDHWPLCGGEFIPDFTEKKTWVEYSHRMMSGLYGLIVIFVFFKLRGHFSTAVRRLNALLLIFMTSEALLGALLVKGQLVTVNDSISRLFVMSLHQINSFMLTGVTFLLYVVLKQKFEKIRLQQPILLVLFIALPLTGAIASLSTTLFPSISLWQGILQDFSSDTHLFVKLRVLHPLIASIISVTFIVWCFHKNLSRLALEFLFAFAIGVVTLLTLSPIPLKLAHLFIAHALWGRLLHTLVNLPDSSKR
ncbi:COX15/CtaA family protein [Pseudobdellovibrio exovorus]|uniref:Cytochrome aa3 controlling protein CtaA n=1 Tax=Pseudobdellovibrio exovorus JSS TaxID=1184267 RepID=M4V8T7_9BACT|nr:COX15/CtaA family protein [Pseudobdellovibrio exovorus]AGH95628.1 cytochrome aa3 controlling protein CtaA [Pseudobdellovibrio exovorus JSS]